MTNQKKTKGSELLTYCHEHKTDLERIDFQDNDPGIILENYNFLKGFIPKVLKYLEEAGNLFQDQEVLGGEARQVSCAKENNAQNGKDGEQNQVSYFLTRKLRKAARRGAMAISSIWTLPF